MSAMRALLLIVVAAMTTFARAADGDAWPARPVRVIASVASGSSLDALARLVAARLATALGQSVVVENRAGAAGNIASDAVAKAAPDGYTLLFTSNSVVTLPALIGERAVDPLTALAPVGIVATQAIVIVAHPAFPAANFRELIVAARAAPNGVAYATSGVGSLAHLTAMLASSQAGIEMLHIPYSGASSFKDVVNGEVPVAFTFMGSALPLVRSGQLKAIAVTSGERSPTAPEVPTLREAGLSGFEVVNWQGLLAPAGTPPAIVARLQAELARLAVDPEFRERLRAMGMTPLQTTPAQFADEIRREMRRWAAVVKAAGLKLD
jgi:tripartite-type tricarboxylate transporter receptor subunit TctC